MPKAAESNCQFACFIQHAAAHTSGAHLIVGLCPQQEAVFAPAFGSKQNSENKLTADMNGLPCPICLQPFLHTLYGKPPNGFWQGIKVVTACAHLLQELYNQLYVHLSTDMHTALNQLIAEVTPARPPSSLSRPSTPAQGGAPRDPTAAKVPGGHQLARLKGLADEAEISDDLRAAERYHQERLVPATNPQVCSHPAHLCCSLTPQQGQLRSCLAGAASPCCGNTISRCSCSLLMPPQRP